MKLGISPLVDFAFKKIFGSPEGIRALIGLLNAVLQLEHPIVEVTLLNPFNYQDFEGAKRIVLDVRARDSTGRYLNVEMQLSVVAGLLQRLTYYACTFYVEQLESGDDYSQLNSCISICLLNKTLFKDTTQSHHCFRLYDCESGRTIRSGIEVHTVELGKYNLSEETIGRATSIEQWAFFLLRAHEYSPERLRELLPAVEFQDAINVAEKISEKTEDLIMYNQRAKAQLDYDWTLKGVRQEGLAKGMKKGLKKGLKKGREEGREEGRVAGQIQLLQRLLGEEEESLDALLARPLTALASQLEDLQERMRNRTK